MDVRKALQSGRSSTDRRIGFGLLLVETTRLLRVTFDGRMEALGLTRSQWHVLIYILKMECPTQTELAESLDISRASIGSLVDQLEGSGYVRRMADETDRRVWRIVPTALARQRTKRIATLAGNVADDAFSGIDDSELAAAARVIEKIRLNMMK